MPVSVAPASLPVAFLKLSIARVSVSDTLQFEKMVKPDGTAVDGMPLSLTAASASTRMSPSWISDGATMLPSVPLAVDDDLNVIVDTP